MEGLVNRAAGLRDFVVARVTDAKPHPDADKLTICTVDTGTVSVDVVCGAPNARAGMKGVFAAAGCRIPGTDITLKKASIRGVESNGMLLSEREMGLSDDHAGIVELPDDAPVGALAVDVMGLSDPVFDVGITPNRGDCLGVRGIARDLAAAGLGELKPLATDAVPGTFKSPIGVVMDFDPETADACPYFVGRYVRGVRNGEGPQWLKDRLLAVGLRPISVLVDITNYMTIGLNRPLHVFDADTVRGGLHVRLARPGERMVALNEKEYELDPDMTVIADDAEPEALGGVMGGLRTACTGGTVNVFVESALFDPVRTAKTGRKLGLNSDARYRFERGVDPAFALPGMEIATRLIVELCGGEASEIVIAGAEPEWRRAVPLRLDRPRMLAGVDVPAGETRRILGALGFSAEGTGDMPQVEVPSWRGDIVGEACLVEEVVRVYGYDRIPTTAMTRETALPKPALAPEQRSRSLARRTLAGRGLVEAVTYSFVSSDLAALFGGRSESLRLVNPISSDLDVMRPSPLPNLIAAAGRNADRGLSDAALFEVGPQYAGDAPEDQQMVAGGIRSGRTGPKNWAQPPRQVDVFDAKADALAVLAAMEVPVDKLGITTDAPDWYHPGRSGVLRLGPKTVLARFGDCHPRVLRRMGVKGPVVAFEVFLDAVPGRGKRRGTARPPLELTPFQPIERDFAFVMDDGVQAADVVGAARSVDRKLIADVRVFDVFSGGGLGDGRKSLAVNVILRPSDKTLTDADIEAIGAKIVAAVEKATGGALRT
jgi:phenylalanyl-tRNA synthetase beta chain